MPKKATPIEEKLRRYSVSENGCWEWSGPKDRDGYGVFGHHRGKQLRAHRASYAVNVGAIPDRMMVCHKCDNRSCINPDHLFIGSPKENTLDMVNKGRKFLTKGALHGMAKLSDKDVSEIIQLRKSGLLLKEIAARYGVTFQHVSLITHRKSWRHL